MPERNLDVFSHAAFLISCGLATVTLLSGCKGTADRKLTNVLLSQPHTASSEFESDRTEAALPEIVEYRAGMEDSLGLIDSEPESENANKCQSDCCSPKSPPKLPPATPLEIPVLTAQSPDSQPTGPDAIESEPMSPKLIAVAKSQTDSHQEELTLPTMVLPENRASNSGPDATTSTLLIDPATRLRTQPVEVSHSEVVTETNDSHRRRMFTSDSVAAIDSTISLASSETIDSTAASDENDATMQQVSDAAPPTDSAFPTETAPPTDTAPPIEFHQVHTHSETTSPTNENQNATPSKYPAIRVDASAFEQLKTSSVTPTPTASSAPSADSLYQPTTIGRFQKPEIVPQQDFPTPEATFTANAPNPMDFPPADEPVPEYHNENHLEFQPLRHAEPNNFSTESTDAHELAPHDSQDLTGFQPEPAEPQARPVESDFVVPAAYEVEVDESDTIRESTSTFVPPTTSDDAIAPLRLLNPQFCKGIRGFGQITPFPQNQFAPQERLLVYCELENYRSMEQTFNDRPRFITRLSGRYTIADSQGNAVQSDAFPEIEDITSRERHDFYFYFPVALADLPDGQYRMSIEVDETATQQRATTSNDLRFTVVKP